MTPTEIQKLRPRHLSRRKWSAIIGVAPSTIGRWESGLRKPSRPAIEMMKIMSKKHNKITK